MIVAPEALGQAQSMSVACSGNQFRCLDATTLPRNPSPPFHPRAHRHTHTHKHADAHTHRRTDLPPPPLQELPGRDPPPLPLIQLPGVQEFRVYKPDLEVYKLNLRGMLSLHKLRPFQCTVSICLMNRYCSGKFKPIPFPR